MTAPTPRDLLAEPPAWLRLCHTPITGFYGALTQCARPAGHDGDHYPSYRGADDLPADVDALVAERVAAVEAVLCGWETTAAKAPPEWGPQMVSVEFAVTQIRAALTERRSTDG